MPGRRRGRSDDEVADLAAALVGLPLAEAGRRAARAGCRISNRSEPGWFTDDQDPHRIRVLVLDDLVVEASVG